MVAEQIQNYVNLVGGVTRATKEKASEAAKGLLAAAGLDDVAADANERVTNMAEEIIAASRANRQLLVKMISAEVDKAAAKIGFARAEDLDALRSEVAELKAALAEQSARAEAAEAAAAEATAAAAAAATEAATSAARKTPARKTAARKTAAKTAPAKKAAAAKKTPAKKATAAKTAPAERAAPAEKAAPAKKAATKKSATKKSIETTEAAAAETS